METIEPNEDIDVLRDVNSLRVERMGDDSIWFAGYSHDGREYHYNTTCTDEGLRITERIEKVEFHPKSISEFVKLTYDNEEDRWVAWYTRLISDVSGFGSTQEQALADLTHKVAMYMIDGSLLDE